MNFFNILLRICLDASHLTVLQLVALLSARLFALKSTLYKFAFQLSEMHAYIRLDVKSKYTKKNLLMASTEKIAGLSCGPAVLILQQPLAQLNVAA